MKIERKCPFCREERFNIEKVGDIYFLKCLNPNISAGMYVEMKRDGRFTQVETYIPQPRVNMKLREQSQFNKLQIPYWKLMGQKAKPQDIVYERELKRRGMTYGDAVMARSLAGGNQSALPQWADAINGKEDNESQYQKS